MVAKLADLNVTLGQAVSQVEGASKKMESAFNAVRSVAANIFAGLTAGLSVGVFVKLISDSIAATAGLKELSERTQSTVEGLSAIGAVAKLSGTDLESVATALQKLAKSQIDAIDGGKKTTEAFRAIGISTKELIGLKPDELYALIAKRLNEYADGSDKSAVAQALLGKAGANQLAVMADLVVVGAYQVKVTRDQAEQADQYEKNLRRLEATQKSIFKTIGIEITPALNALAVAFLNAANGSDGLRGTVKSLADDGSIAAWAQNAARVVGFVGDAFQGVSRIVQATGLYIGATAAAFVVVLDSSLKQIGPRLAAMRADLKADLDAIANAPLFSKQVEEQLAKIKLIKGAAGGAAGADVTRPSINFRPNTASAQGSADDPAKAVLEGQLKVLEQQIAAEKNALALRNKLIDTFNREGLLSFETYYAAKKGSADAALQVEQTNIDKEIALLAARVKIAPKSVEAATDQGKIDVLIERRKKLVSDAAIANIDAIEQQRISLIAYGKEMQSVEADVLTLNESFAAAAAIRFDSSHDVLTKRFTVEGNRQGLASLQILRDYTVAQGLFQQVTVSAARSQESLALAESRIQLLQQTGKITAIEALIAVGEERKKSIVLQEQQIAAEEAIARASDNPALIMNAEKARNALEQLKASVDPLADKINTSLASSFTNAFAGFLQGTMTASQAFKAFASAVISDIARMEAEKLAAKIFGGGLGGGGLGGLLSSLLGGFGGRATGGGISAGGMAQVGENGPEVFSVQGKTFLLAGNAGGVVTPAGSGSSGPVINIQIAAGVQRSELFAILPQLKEQIRAEIVTSMRRPGFA